MTKTHPHNELAALVTTKNPNIQIVHADNKSVNFVRKDDTTLQVWIEGGTVWFLERSPRGPRYDRSTPYLIAGIPNPLGIIAQHILNWWAEPQNTQRAQS